MSETGNGRIRVVRIIDRLNVGGPAKHVTWLTAGLDPSEFETVLITGVVPPGEVDMSYFAREAGISPRVIPEMSRELGPRDVVVIWKLLGELRRLRPDVIHTHKSKAGAAGRVAALLYRWLTPSALRLRPRRVSIVHTFHGHTFHSYFSPAKSRFFIAVEQALARLCTDRIITISDQQRDEINGRYGVGRPSQLRVIPLGIDFGEFGERRGRLRSSLGLADDVILVGIVGRLCEVKNHALLLEAAALAPAGRLRYVVIGDGELRADLEAHARRLGITDRVHFTGFRDDAGALYGDLDIVALTSRNEGTPLTLIEGMGCGRAVATTEVGGVVDLLGRRLGEEAGVRIWEHGVSTPSGDAEAFARAISYLAAHPERRAEMGARGRDFVRSRLSKERLIGEISALYRDLHGRSAT